MKKYLILFVFPLALAACNNEASNDPVDTADSLNNEKLDSTATQGPNTVIQVDKETADFMVRAANGSMAEVEMGRMAQQKANDQSVKNFAAMMIQDHSAASDQLKTFASQRNVTLPDSVGGAEDKVIRDLVTKSPRDFDKAYLNAMIDDHEKDLKLFKNAGDNIKDPEVKTFVMNTIPKLQTHLDSVKAIQKRIK